MKTSAQLRNLLQSIDRKSYPAYKSLAGQYSFGDYTLSIDHVQGDPFASPSRLSIHIAHDKAGFPHKYWDKEHTRIALQNYVTIQFCRQADAFSFKAKGSGKSGLLTVSRPGQEVLERTACSFEKDRIVVRFQAGFPANGRTINARELDKILFDFLPQCVSRACCYRNLPSAAIEEVFCLAEDQEYIRTQLPMRHLTAFVADGSILPRKSGASDLPMKDGIPFETPASLAVTLHLPHRGPVTGMGIPEGITLIAGGGYHGKSTLLKALEAGVYNHIAGDGRELVITNASALKLRAEDGRKIKNVDISLFIRNLPNGKSTESFSTEDASGSTSQAANIIEGIASGSTVFLIDEDTSATNFMVRDELMQHVIARDKEPIIPFLERARDLYDQSGISSILVVGSCGSYFHIADTVLQMDCYRPLDITEKAKDICSQYPKPSVSAPGYRLPDDRRSFSLNPQTGRPSGHLKGSSGDDRLKIKVMGKDGFTIGKEYVNLHYVEQLKDSEQTAALAYILKYAKDLSRGQDIPVKELVDKIMYRLHTQGLASVCGSSYVPSGMAMPRVQEIYACLNRY